ncbi:MAG: sulfatase-like hydrolase/transferase [Thermoguttaceae bacterium]|nr:sulfatase-like hydrolase/transferase [Thermoguttaceae bacterium]
MRRTALFLATALGAVCADAAAAEGSRMNVLFIAVDDLRPELGCYGHPVVKSPHIDRLAARGTVFERAYCQQAVCNPSRASLMTGLRPDTLQVYDLPTNFRTHKPDVVTVAQHFKNHGYYTEGIGKIYHTGHGNTDDAPSWSVMRRHPRSPRFGPEGQEVLKRQRAEWKAAGRDPSRARGLPWEAPDVADADLADGSIAEGAVTILREVKDRPFFLAVGFLNPHLPFVAPKKYWDLYSAGDIRLASNPHPPEGAPSYATHNSGELRAYYGIPQQGPLSDEQARNMVHGYWAAVSYMDACVGRLLDELDRLGLRDNTIVILWGDHGWFLGEHGMWCKHANYEEAARAPLIISVPGQEPGKSPALVEFVDIYPTLADLCGLPLHDWLEGTSFKPLVANPDLPWKKAAFHLYPRRIPDQGAGMGRAIRTGRYRLVEWTVPNKDFAEYELYDLETDPGENVNLAVRSEHAALVEQLRSQLHAGWRAALPPAESVSR